MDPIETRGWMALTNVVKDFLRNKKAHNYKELVAELLLSFQDLKCNMRIKFRFLKSHLDTFPENLGYLSDEQVESLHKDIKVMDRRYEGCWDIHMMADYCWSIASHKPQAPRKRKALKRQFASN